MQVCPSGSAGAIPRLTRPAALYKVMTNNAEPRLSVCLSVSLLKVQGVQRAFMEK